MRKFWKWINQAEAEERVLELNGTIAEESWFDDDITPRMFKDELYSGSGPITVWINSPGGDCIAASQIYSMLMDYKGEVTVKIDGIAASAASVIAMAGTKVVIAPTALIMIHNPSTSANGDHRDMSKTIEVLNEVKESTSSLPLQKKLHILGLPIFEDIYLSNRNPNNRAVKNSVVFLCLLMRHQTMFRFLHKIDLTIYLNHPVSHQTCSL